MATEGPLTAHSPRERFNRFFVDHEVAWELLMAGFALAYVGIGLVVDQLAEGAQSELAIVEWALTVAFVLEFASRLGAAHDRGAYLRGHWVDVVALAPPIRGARILRLLRLLRLVRALSGLYRVVVHMKGLAEHRGFAWLLIAWIGVMVICSAWLYTAEHGINKTIDSPFDALWWGVSTLTTVGYGDAVPVTPEGKLAAMTLMFLGIGLFSAITATIASYLISTQQHGTGRKERLLDELERLQALRSAGALDEGEFAEAKRRILG